MKISIEFLKENKICPENIEFMKENNLLDKEDINVITKLVEIDNPDLANRLITKILTHTDKIKYAIYIAEKTLHFFEERYPNDDRPRKAVEEAKTYISNPKKQTGPAIYAIEDEAYSAYLTAENSQNSVNASYAALAAYVAIITVYSPYPDVYIRNIIYYINDKEISKTINYGIELIQKNQLHAL